MGSRTILGLAQRFVSLPFTAPATLAVIPFHLPVPPPRTVSLPTTVNLRLTGGITNSTTPSTAANASFTNRRARESPGTSATIVFVTSSTARQWPRIYNDRGVLPVALLSQQVANDLFDASTARYGICLLIMVAQPPGGLGGDPVF